MPSTPPTHRLLFVCLGNICRSPLAEGVMRHLARERGVLDRLRLDSAGTGGWHAGAPADPRMRRTAAAHGIELTSRARAIEPADLERFDRILCMDRRNLEDVRALGAGPAQAALLLEFHPAAPGLEVPDPYHGAEDGFETVYALVEGGCRGLLERLFGKDPSGKTPSGKAESPA